MQIALFGGKQTLKFEKYLSVEASMRFKGLAHAGRCANCYFAAVPSRPPKLSELTGDHLHQAQHKVAQALSTPKYPVLRSAVARES